MRDFAEITGWARSHAGGGKRLAGRVWLRFTVLESPAIRRLAALAMSCRAQRPRLRLIGLLLPLVLMACGDSSDLFRPATGTGSAGGNPLVVSFRHDPQSARNDREWRTPLMLVGQMRVSEPGASGGCSLEGAELRDVDRTFQFDELSQLLFHEPFPCGIVLLPPLDRPLLTFEARIGRGKLARVEVWAELGMHIRILEPERLNTSQDIFFLIKVDRLLDRLDIDETLRTENRVVYSDRSSDGPDQADRVRANFVTAAHIYLDPTPGDGRLRRDERTNDNLIGRASLLMP